MLDRKNTRITGLSIEDCSIAHLDPGHRVKVSQQARSADLWRGDVDQSQRLENPNPSRDLLPDALFHSRRQALEGLVQRQIPILFSREDCAFHCVSVPFAKIKGKNELGGVVRGSPAFATCLCVVRQICSVFVVAATIHNRIPRPWCRWVARPAGFEPGALVMPDIDHDSDHASVCIGVAFVIANASEGIGRLARYSHTEIEPNPYS